MKYYSLRILAALFVMGSFGVGFLAGAEYGKWIGWACFIIVLLTGVILHFVAKNNTVSNKDEIDIDALEAKRKRVSAKSQNPANKAFHDKLSELLNLQATARDNFVPLQASVWQAPRCCGQTSSQLHVVAALG